MQSAWLGAPLVLGVALWLRGAVLAAAGQPAGSQVCKSECAKFHKRIPWHLLQSYERAECGKPAVLLTTKKNRTLCANPDEPWVQKAMLQLDAKKVDPSVPEEPGEFQKRLGMTTPMTTQAGHPLYPTETFSTAAYGMSTTSVKRTEGPEPSAVNSMSVGPQTTKSSTGSTYKPEVPVSGTTVQPEPLANGSMVSYFTDGPQSFGEGLTSVGKGLVDISGTTNDLVVPPTSRGAVDDEYQKSPTQPTLHPSSTIINLLRKDSTLNNALPLPSDGQGSAIKPVTENPTVGLSAGSQRRDFTSPTGILASTGGPTDAHTSMSGSRSNSVENRSDTARPHTKTSDAPLSTQANTNVFSKFSDTVAPPTLHEEHASEKSREEAAAPSAEVPLTFLPGALAGYRSHIISVVFLGVLCISLAIAGVYARNHICSRASPTEMVQGLTFSRYDLQTGADAMQVL